MHIQWRSCKERRMVFLCIINPHVDEHRHLTSKIRRFSQGTALNLKKGTATWNVKKKQLCGEMIPLRYTFIKDDNATKNRYINYSPNDRRSDRWLFPSRGFLTHYALINLNLPLGLTTVHARRINVWSFQRSSLRALMQILETDRSEPLWKLHLLVQRILIFDISFSNW